MVLFVMLSAKINLYVECHRVLIQRPKKEKHISRDCDCDLKFIFFLGCIFEHIFVITDKSQAMNDLAYVKEVIQALPFDHKKELFDHFIKNFSTKNQATKTPTEDIHPSTPEPTTSSKESQKRLLNSPLTPKRNKKDKKVLFIIILS